MAEAEAAGSPPELFFEELPVEVNILRSNNLCALFSARAEFCHYTYTVDTIATHPNIHDNLIATTTATTSF
jgi:hypothetical protein